MLTDTTPIQQQLADLFTIHRYDPPAEQHKQ
jgi:hypothetical protein